MTDGPRLLARLGLSIIHPRWAFTVATERKHAGRAGTDLMLVLIVMLLATQLRELVTAAWLGVAVNAGLGMHAALRVLTGTLTIALAFLVIAAVILWLAGGARRELGRAFDLACVAALPLLYVMLGAAAIARGFELAIPPIVTTALSGLAFAWSGSLVALAVRNARAGERKHHAEVPANVLVRARRAGWGVLALALAGLAIQSVSVARNLEGLRPMRHGDPAPAFALPSIGPLGEPGPRVELAASRGKVTVLDFWATWCSPCLRSLPHLDAMMREHPELAVLAINLDDAVQARSLWDSQRYRMALLADDGSVSRRYGVSDIPHTVVIDRAGVVRMVARGRSAKDIERMVETILAE